MAQISFNANSVAASPSFEPIPPGNYEAVITDSIMKPTKSANGYYLELTFEVISGEYRGRRIWSRLNLQNPNPKAVEIAQRDLASICRATGAMELTDTNQLHNIPMIITVRARVTPDGEATSEIRSYAPKAGYTAPAPAVAPVPPVAAPVPPVAAPAPTPPPAPQVSPWAR